MLKGEDLIETCQQCQGTGTDPPAATPVEVPNLGMGPGVVSEAPCPKCNGTGGTLTEPARWFARSSTGCGGRTTDSDEQESEMGQAMKITPICAEDLLDAARTIPLGDIHTCNWLWHWLSAEQFLEWANRGLQEGDDYGLSNAICYAKRSAACRIDLLLQYQHLVPYFRQKYPAKIEALRQVGLKIPNVVQELVIEPRNQLEHGYERPAESAARHAVEIGELFLGATDEETERQSIVAVRWNVSGSYAAMLGECGREFVNFRGFSKHPMLFIDVFDDPHSAKIVDPANDEIRATPLADFSAEQSIALAKVLRSNFSQSSVHTTGAGTKFFREMKRQGNF